MSQETIRVGDAPRGSTPFYRAEDGLHFDGQNGRVMDYGHTFDRQRGYRVFFAFRDAFRDVGAVNIWGAESLQKWAEKLKPADDEQVQFQRIASSQAKQCIALNKEWERLGRPAAGVPMTPKGNA